MSEGALMAQRLDAQATPRAATAETSRADDDMRLLWQTSLMSMQEEREAFGSETGRHDLPATPMLQPAKLPTPHSPVPIAEPVATTLAVQRQLALAGLPGAERAWHIALPSAWELLAVRHDASASAPPTWTLTLCTPAMRGVAAAAESQALTASLERLQTRLGRLASPVQARVVMSGSTGETPS